MRFLFVMDPPGTMHPQKDTSFAFMRGALARGHELLHAEPHHLSVEGDAVFVRARKIEVSDTAPHVRMGDGDRYRVGDLDAVFIRKDPPFDAAYLYLTHLLDLVKARVLVLNDPQGIRDANEKLFAFHFSEFTPRSLVTANPEEIRSFVDAHGDAVLKPLDGAGGSGVVVLKPGDRNVRSLADIWTSEGRRLALVQEYQPAVRTGDKRVLVLNGHSMGAILRVPREDDVRANIHAGGRVVETELTPAEARLVSNVGPRLAAQGLYFVGLDLIGERLIEVNVTSPTGIQELGRFAGRPVEEDVIAWVEGRAAKLRA